MTLLIIDEGAFVPDETTTAVRPMLAVSNGRILAMSTPFGRRGWFHGASKSGEWRVTIVTADQCPRISREFLEAERRALGEWRYRQEYLCEFVDIAGLMFSTDDIEAIFTAGQLGAIPPGALFGAPRTIEATVPALPRPRLEPAPYCSGHIYRNDRCGFCGAPRPALLPIGGPS